MAGKTWEHILYKLVLPPPPKEKKQTDPDASGIGEFPLKIDLFKLLGISIFARKIYVFAGKKKTQRAQIEKNTRCSRSPEKSQRFPCINSLDESKSHFSHRPDQIDEFV